MANPEHLAKLKESVEVWNKWRVGKFKRPDLSAADLHGMNLSGAHLFRVSLEGANLTGADLSRADLNKANLSASDMSGTDCSGTDFNQAHLADAIFSGADLTGADLSEADLSGVNFRWADLKESDFYDSFLWGAMFLGNDLSTVKNLETIRHQGSSTIDVETIVRSKGRIPSEFLRGVGVPDDFITYAKSLVANPIEFYSCFISYSTKDQDFADRLYADLQHQGVRCWFAPHETSEVAGNSTNRLTKPSACMTSCY